MLRSVTSVLTLPSVKELLASLINKRKPTKLDPCQILSGTNIPGNIAKAVEVGMRILSGDNFFTKEFFGLWIEELTYTNVSHDELRKIEEKLEAKKNVTSKELAIFCLNFINNQYYNSYGHQDIGSLIFVMPRMIKEAEEILALYRSKGPSFMGADFNVDLSIDGFLNAEADLILNDTLIDIKTSAQTGLQSAHYLQTLIYFILAKNTKKYQHITKFGIYFTRQNQLVEWNANDIFKSNDFTKLQSELLTSINNELHFEQTGELL